MFERVTHQGQSALFPRLYTLHDILAFYHHAGKEPMLVQFTDDNAEQRKAKEGQAKTQQKKAKESKTTARQSKVLAN